MSDAPTPYIHIRVFKSDGFIPSEQTAAALEALAIAVADDAAESAEVSGFSYDGERLAIGSELKSTIAKPGPLDFCIPAHGKGREGCLGLVPMGEPW